MTWRTLLTIAALRALLLVAAQPLAGGGGGGGGGFGGGGGGFDDGDDYDTPSCPPHCHYCSAEDVCEECHNEYKLMHDGSCQPCPSGCERCDVHGPYECDKCFDRHVLVLTRLCEPCADHCRRCDVAGPGACDNGDCDWGYVINNAKLKVCEACTKHCGICIDTTDSGCLKCRTFYKLDKGNCSLDMTFLSGVLSTLVIVALTFCFMHNRERTRRSGTVLEPLLGSLATHETFIAVSEISRSSSDSSWRSLPSGIWRGYYTHSDARHDVCEFTLEFRPDGSATGGGVDDVGEYNIGGKCNRSGSRLAFTKTYSTRSRNIARVVSYGNQGHGVEYRGELVTGQGGAMGGGFRGDWAIRHEMGNVNGSFHIWPAMEGWQEPEMELDAQPQQRTFEVESECVVCFDNPIATILRPCGHQVLCRECACRLRSPPTCPICRARISTISDRAGE